MAISKELIKKIKDVKELSEKEFAKKKHDNNKQLEYAEALRKYGQYVLETENDRNAGLKAVYLAKRILERVCAEMTNGTMWDLEKWAFEQKCEIDLLNRWYDCLKIEAQNQVLDSYMQFVERKRYPQERFYRPKRDQLRKHGLIQGLQDMIDDKLDILSISMPPGTCKTTLSKFFISAVMGWFPEDYSIFFSHSDGITRMYYDGVLDIIESNEYCWREIFPKVKFQGTNAKMQTINLGKYKPFPSLQCASLYSKLAGKIRCNKFALCDDLISSIEEALNKEQLDKIWNKYAVDIKQRKVPGCKEIHIATRWSVHDVIGRLERTYESSSRCRFIAVPDIDEETGTSNFDYEFNGFDVQFFQDQQLSMDDISYQCLYKNKPIEREGLLYHNDELRRFELPPGKEPDAVLSVCDTKAKGSDFLVLPIFKQYGNDYYLVDCVCTDSCDYGVQYEKIASILVEYGVQQCEFESNSGGDRVAYEVDKLVKAKGGRCNITTKPTETNKETRIIVNSDWIKKNVLFKMEQDYNAKSDYGVMMRWLLSYSIVGRNSHDDVPDCLANFVLFVNRKFRVVETKIIKGGLF